MDFGLKDKSYFMKRFFVNNGGWLTVGLAILIYFIGLPDNYLPEFSNSFLTTITYGIIVFLPVSLSIYFKNKK